MSLTLEHAKSQAKALRQALAVQGNPISHAQALELIAKQHGARDWNTLFAKLSKNTPRAFQVGDQVQGSYLGQPYKGKVVSVARAGDGYNLSLQLKQPVDTVEFESFSNMRSLIRGFVGVDGVSPRKTSNGRPQLVVELG